MYNFKSILYSIEYSIDYFNILCNDIKGITYD
jgi:hypothetical protein